MNVRPWLSCSSSERKGTGAALVALVLHWTARASFPTPLPAPDHGAMSSLVGPGDRPALVGRPRGLAVEKPMTPAERQRRPAPPEDSHLVSGCAQNGPVTARPSAAMRATCIPWVPRQLPPRAPDAAAGAHATADAPTAALGAGFASARSIPATSLSARAMSTPLHLQTRRRHRARAARGSQGPTPDTGRVRLRPSGQGWDHLCSRAGACEGAAGGTHDVSFSRASAEGSGGFTIVSNFCRMDSPCLRGNLRPGVACTDTAQLGGCCTHAIKRRERGRVGQRARLSECRLGDVLIEKTSYPIPLSQLTMSRSTACVCRGSGGHRRLGRERARLGWRGATARRPHSGAGRDSLVSRLMRP